MFMIKIKDKDPKYYFTIIKSDHPNFKVNDKGVIRNIISAPMFPIYLVICLVCLGMFGFMDYNAFYKYKYVYLNVFFKQRGFWAMSVAGFGFLMTLWFMIYITYYRNKIQFPSVADKDGNLSKRLFSLNKINIQPANQERTIFSVNIDQAEVVIKPNNDKVFELKNSFKVLQSNLELFKVDNYIKLNSITPAFIIWRLVMFCLLVGFSVYLAKNHALGLTRFILYMCAFALMIFTTAMKFYHASRIKLPFSNQRLPLKSLNLKPFNDDLSLKKFIINMGKSQAIILASNDESFQILKKYSK